MCDLTKQERLVLVLFIFILLLGSLLSYLFKTNPRFACAVEILDTDRIYYKTDINQAAHDELIAIPGIGPATAKRILSYRQEHGPFRSLEELRSIKGISLQNYQKIVQFLKVKN
ncbi:MAG: helix-hairpin-helix domain-containing protein [Candidatus Omnitrophota bacterium]